MSTVRPLGLFERQLVQPPVRLKMSEKHELQELVKSVGENEACVYWYFGAHGLKQGAIDFYRDAITANIVAGALPFLVDLWAWSALSSRNSNAQFLKRFQKSAISLECDKLKTLLSSEFFARLGAIKAEEPACKIIAEITTRKALCDPSLQHKNLGVKLGDVFNRECPALAPIYDLDCASSYSMMQYIEILFLIEMILQKSEGKITNIKFILPNDESKYYLSTLSQDINEFLQARGVSFKQLNIDIACFNFGTDISQRPYNIPSTTLSSKKELHLDDITKPAALNYKIA